MRNSATGNSVKLTDAKIGDRVQVFDGYSTRIGKVYGWNRSRFGDSLRIKFDDYTFDSAFSFNDRGSGQIGFNLIGRA